MTAPLQPLLLRCSMPILLTKLFSPSLLPRIIVPILLTKLFSALLLSTIIPGLEILPFLLSLLTSPILWYYTTHLLSCSHALITLVTRSQPCTNICANLLMGQPRRLTYLIGWSASANRNTNFWWPCFKICIPNNGWTVWWRRLPTTNRNTHFGWPCFKIRIPNIGWQNRWWKRLPLFWLGHPREQ